AVDSLIEDAVIEHDVGRLAAEFERHLLEAARGQLVDARAGSRTTRERDLGDLRMRDERLADDCAVARDDVDDARRHTGFLDDELDELEQRGGGELAWLDDDRAARG